MASLSRALRPVARRQLPGPLLARRALFSSKSDSGSGSGSSGPVDPKSDAELQVGELQGAKFRVEPLRRVGEAPETTRARLLYQSRKRGTLESDLVLSTFADAYLPTMSVELMSQYDRFLDENDWDIYYWVTQEEPHEKQHQNEEPRRLDSATFAGGESYRGVPPGSSKTVDAGSTEPTQQPRHLDSATFTGAEAYRGVPPGSPKTVDAGSTEPAPGQDIHVRPRAEGEWAQTVGTFKPAYRPVPSRWRDSEILRLIREHVRSRRADIDSGKGEGRKGEGMAFMPPLRP